MSDKTGAAADDLNFANDLKSLMPRASFSRRQALVTTLATGFALATHPVCAQTAVSTPADGLEAGEVQIPATDVDIPAYRAMPTGPGPFPVILVVQEIFGVHEYIKDICRRLAKEGYMAIAPQMYARQGDVLKLSNIDEIRAIVAKVPDAQVMSDLDSAVDFAKLSGKADTTRLGITGFCWGGRITWLYAAHNAGVKAGVAWYGRLVGETSPLTPKNPIDFATDLHAPILGLYGGEDQGIPVDSVEKMRAACKAAGKTCDIIVYPGAPHAFHADYRPSYRAEPAKDGWSRLLGWFKQNGLKAG